MEREVVGASIIAVEVICEPSTAPLLGAGLIGLPLRRRSV